MYDLTMSCHDLTAIGRSILMTIKVNILPKHQSIVQSSDRVIDKLANNKHPHIYQRPSIYLPVLILSANTKT